MARWKNKLDELEEMFYKDTIFWSIIIVLILGLLSSIAGLITSIIGN